jgi:hypothetical protein
MAYLKKGRRSGVSETKIFFGKIKKAIQKTKMENITSIKVVLVSLD